MVIFTDFPCCNALVWVGNIPLVRGNMLVDSGVSIVNVVCLLRHQKSLFGNGKETYQNTPPFKNPGFPSFPSKKYIFQGHFSAFGSLKVGLQKHFCFFLNVNLYIHLDPKANQFFMVVSIG